MHYSQYFLNPPSLRTPDGTLVLLSKDLRGKCGAPVGSIVGHNKEDMTSKVKLMKPRNAEKCAVCGGPVRVNRTTGAVRCRDLDSCGHSHGFEETTKVITTQPSEYSVMADE